MSDYPLDFTPQCPQVAWLTERLGGWQFGEQDLLVAVAEALDIDAAAEIGAGDGESLPVTIHNLCVKLECDCLLFESDPAKVGSLMAIYKKQIEAKTLNIKGEYVPGELGRKSKQGIGGCQLVVIDIDGKDSQVMQQVMKQGQAEVVVCEHMDRHYPIGTSAPSPFPIWSLGHELTSNYRIQDTAETLQWMAGNLGYERFGYNRCNSFFVRQDRFADLFR